ncbi:MAG: hypothetical protein F4Z00_17390 [Acidimicrobiaceae bacterium]|nr:hypothetical protein [Acidimicrobiaceae bacterium]MXZ67303.1 hypothetical protein [Acidimicrobiaceae bacterium]MYF32618.1 hypothetical protein [Acidimicrobiaceae bacterium]MYG78258.1 hypothetical protein [Acidimicrobiaceae bacterium]MYJ30858.1 hypothetical protein [Acidimicrobiaceae bacterium]
MSDYSDSVAVLSGELAAVEACIAGLSSDDWARTTKLDPFDETAPRWTVKELVAHIDISIGLTAALIDSAQDGQTGRDRVSFFIANRNEVAPVVYDYAVGLAAEHTNESMAQKVSDTFAATVEGASSNPPGLIGSGFFALMTLEEWVPTRTVEAVAHGMDLTNALERDPIATPAGTAVTAAILDELLARRTVAGRPADLDDDLAFIRAASGRGEHSDPRFPLIV